jgi:hypothetical protein
MERCTAGARFHYLARYLAFMAGRSWPAVDDRLFMTGCS